MTDVGGVTLTVEQRGDVWAVIDQATGEQLTFAGIAPYEEPTKEAALKEARRLASKWDWRVVEETA